MSDNSNLWQTISRAPLDTVVDILAKKWDVETDTFHYRRFTECTVTKGWGQHAITKYAGVERDWRPVFYMIVPGLPDGVLGKLV